MLNICWIRRDLRLKDHAALSQSLQDGQTIIVFVFDTKILDLLANKNDQRVSFIYDSLIELEKELKKYNSSIYIAYGDPTEEIPRIATELSVQNVFCNRDYEPYAKKRDKAVEDKLRKSGINFFQFKDSVIFEKQEVLTKTQSTFKVFTPYKNRWLEVFEGNEKVFENYPTKLRNLYAWENTYSIENHDWYKVIGFNPTAPTLSAGRENALKRLKKFEKDISQYHQLRDYPALNATSLLSVYLRHGNISIREAVKFAKKEKDQGHKTWLNELVWRDFYQMILDVYPRIENSSFKPQYDKIKFPNDPDLFQSWCEGKTGFPLVDAAMRCLNETGLMHNRLRMLCASFLCKTLLVDWKKGEKYFAEKLLDYDLAANNGGWQWSSSSGCDAQPYFRIFNPYTQSEKFDPDGVFIKQWIPELRNAQGKEIHHPNPLLSSDYPLPVVNYETSRLKCAKIYEVVKNK